MCIRDRYNLIKLIWAQVKRYVANKNTTLRLADIEQLAHKALDRITHEDWAKCVRHAEALQEADYSKQCRRDHSGALHHTLTCE